MRIVFTVLLFSCGGDDEVVDETTSQADEPSTPALDKPEVEEVLIITPPCPESESIVQAAGASRVIFQSGFKFIFPSWILSTYSLSILLTPWLSMPLISAYKRTSADCRASFSGIPKAIKISLTVSGFFLTKLAC